MNTKSLIDRLFYDNRREYTVKQGNIAYLDSKPLRRPFKMPAAQRVILIVIVIAAVVVGFVIINNTLLQSIRETQAEAQSVVENLKREASIDTIPKMNEYIKLSNEEVKAKLIEQGFSIYDASQLDDSGELNLYKIPSDMTTDDAVLMYLQGVNSLSASQASKLLVGSWYFGVDRVNTTSMVTRYADFSTSDPEIAVQNALQKEGFPLDSLLESGVDESGNTYSMGNIDVDGTICVWKISALPLNQMYSIRGLPEDACYVGVRITA